MADVEDTSSPQWNWTTKLLVGMVFAVIFGFLLARFRNYIGPLLLVFILTYLSYPVARRLRDGLHMSWRLAVTLLYLLIILLLIGVVTLGGLALIEQAQSLYGLVYYAVTNQLPELINNLTSQVYTIGPFTIDFTEYGLASLNQQFLSYIQPILGQIGGLVTTIATGAAGFLGWIGFVLLISYFITAESTSMSEGSFRFNIPGHTYDIRRLTKEFGSIWNAFLRGQVILFLLTVVIYVVLLTALQVRYAFGLALLAGFARFLPYIGPAIAWTAYALVSFFQGYTWFGIPPVAYTGLVIGLAILVDTLFDNFISPKIMGQALKVHPAAVLISALVLANLIGVIGVLLAAPVLATIQLVFQYTVRKLFDQDPWEDLEYMDDTAINGFGFLPEPVKERIIVIWNRAIKWIKQLWITIRKWWGNLRASSSRNPGNPKDV